MDILASELTADTSNSDPLTRESLRGREERNDTFPVPSAPSHAASLGQQGKSPDDSIETEIALMRVPLAAVARDRPSAWEKSRR